MVLLFLLNVINDRMPILTSLGKRKKQKQFIIYKFKLTLKGFTIDFWCGPIELQPDSFVTNMQPTNFYFFLFTLFFLVHGAPTPLLNVSQAVGWQENQLQIPHKGSTIIFTSQCLEAIKLMICTSPSTTGVSLKSSFPFHNRQHFLGAKFLPKW
jgi:hypothetical protein